MLREQNFYVKGAYLLIFLFLLTYALILGQSLLAPICVSTLISILLLPVAAKMEKWGIHRLISSILCAVIMLLMVGLFIFLFSEQVSMVTKNLPALQVRFFTKLDHLQAFIQQKTDLTPSKQMEWIKEKALGLSGNVLGSASSIVVMLPVPFYVFFFLFYRDKFGVFLLKITRPDQRYTVEKISSEIRMVIQSYLSGLLIVMGVMTCILSAGLHIIGVPYYLFLGALAAILNIIPYLGIGFSALLSILVAFLTKDSDVLALEVFLLFLGTHLIEANIITPKIVGSKVSVNPFTTIVALILGEMIWGIMGMILFIPLSGVLKVIFDNIEATKPYGFLLGTEGTEEYAFSMKNIFRRKKRQRANKS